MRTISKVKGRKGEIYKNRFDIKDVKKENLIEFDDIFLGKEKSVGYGSYFLLYT